jgi:hypothetical protein
VAPTTPEETATTPAEADPVAPAERSPSALPTGAASAAPQRDDALNLGATVLPILARTYWKQGLVVLLVIALVVWLLVR